MQKLVEVKVTVLELHLESSGEFIEELILDRETILRCKTAAEAATFLNKLGTKIEEVLKENSDGNPQVSS